MIRRLDLRRTAHTASAFRALIPRPSMDVEAVLEPTRTLIDDVRRNGSTALLDQAERFDGVRPESLRVRATDIAAAVTALDSGVRDALEESIDRLRRVTSAQVPDETHTEVAPGASVVQRWHPVARAGVYVPGGKAVYPSSVVMNVVPAQVAGVSSIALASPPQREYGGSVHPVVLGAAGLLGVEEVYAMGGAGAIGALAWGVPDIGLDAVNTVTGPGNIFVAAAKRLVNGHVGIDSEAGTTEILIIADESAKVGVVSADLISQAEHDEAAAAVLVTTSEEFADEVTRELERQCETTRHGERVRTALGGEQSAIVLVDDIVAAAAFTNAYAPEHLEIQVKVPDDVLPLIHDAGAIFVGENTPVSLGDYMAGSNHVLPTGGAARFSAALGAYTFLRPQQIVRYSRDALGVVSGAIRVLSDAEDLPAHGDAVVMRMADARQ